MGLAFTLVIVCVGGPTADVDLAVVLAGSSLKVGISTKKNVDLVVDLFEILRRDACFGPCERAVFGRLFHRES